MSFRNRTLLTLKVLALASCVLGAEFVFHGLVPADREQPSPETALAQAVAATLVSDLPGDQESPDDCQDLQQHLSGMVQALPSLRSVGIRRFDGRLVAEEGNHTAAVDTLAAAETHQALVEVPLETQAGSWGTLEAVFEKSPADSAAAPFSVRRVAGLVLSLVLFAVTLFFSLDKWIEPFRATSAVPHHVRQALDTLTEGLLILDCDHRIALVNKAFSSLIQMEPEKLIGEKADDLPWEFSGEGGDGRFPWRTAMDLQTSQSKVTLHLNLPRGRRTFLVNASPVFGDDGSHRGVMVSLDDITQLESTKAELRRSKEVAERANLAKSDFLARMSHEIRTPLNVVLGYTEVLRRGFDKTIRERREYLDTIHNSGELLLELINDILDLSKIEAGRLELNLTAVSPYDIAQDVVTLLQGRANEKGLKLAVEVRDRVPSEIFSDATRLKQILMNLVGNAIKFTERGAVEVHLRTIATNDGIGMAFDVCDTGIGIAPEALRHVFDPFCQADQSITRRYGGTGLGLSISKRLALALGGDVTVQSAQGMGSRFTVVVSAGPSETLQFATQGELVGRLELKKSSQLVGMRRLRNARVLVVDDGVANRRLIELVLTRVGVQVTLAENGREAVDLAMAQPFDVILLDMQMPVMDGYSAARELRQRGYRSPIISLTAHAMQGDEAKCRAAGCSGYLTKPVDLDQLVEALAQVIGYDDSGAPVQDPYPVGRRGIVETGGSSELEPPSSDGGVGNNQPILSRLPMNDSDFRDIVADFIDRCSTRLEQMEELLKQRDFVGLAKQAHWLKGSGGTAGFPDLTQAARELETAAKSQNEPAAAVALAVLQQLQQRMTVPELVS